MKPLVVYGAGGFAREVVELVRDINRREPTWEIVGLLDDNRDSWGRVLNDVPILGSLEWLERDAGKPYMVFGVGGPAAKRRMHARTRTLVAGYPTLVHPTAVMSKSVDLAEGVVVTAGNILTANISVGPFAMLNLMCTVGHDSTIGAYASLSPAVNVSGNVHIAAGCDIGTGVKLIPGATIGAWSVVGAGGVVTKPLPANCTAVGVPAKVVNEREAGWHEHADL